MNSMEISPRAKKRLQKLKSLAKGAKSAYILIYSNPDPDALASAWGLKEVLHEYGAPAHIGYTGQVGRLQNAAMIQYLKLPAETLDLDKLGKADLVAMVDAQPAFFKDIYLPRCDIVIDHHPKKSDKKYPLVDIRPKTLSTCSIITEYLMAQGRSIPKRLATALLYGMQTDSRGQNKTPTPLDQSAVRFLEKSANLNLIKRIESSQYLLNDLDYFSIALLKLRYAGEVLYAHVGPVPYIDVCVQVADFLIRVKEAHWALVTGVEGNKLVVVFRCDGNQKDVGKLAQKAFGELGSAGGHRTMGRAEISAQKLPDDVRLTNNESCEWFVVDSLAKVDPAFRPLLRKFRKEGIAVSEFNVESQ